MVDGWQRKGMENILSAYVGITKKGVIMGISINQGDLVGQLAKIAKNYKAKHEVAEFRTLNIISRRGIKKAKKEIKKNTGHKVSTVNRAVRIKNATRKRPVVTWYISGKRIQYPGVKAITATRKLKKGGSRKFQTGISYLAEGRKRIRYTKNIKSGSKPFVVIAPKSGKKIAVFVEDNTMKRTRIGKNQYSGRTLSTFYGHSITKIMGWTWEQELKNWMKKEMVREYPKQLEKAKFR